ncbi:MAG: CBS domain-containing protein [Thermodesulfobacteriota bacterium]|jgi:CBS domain-containing protein|nr:CBS domain-containing protein [Thermodesulfobacteriota bacterium]
MKVEEIMNKKIEYIEPEATVYDAIEKMVDKRIRSLLVNPKDEQDVYGLITVRDIVFRIINKNLNPRKIKVVEITSKPLVCVAKDMSIEHVMALMEKFNIARVIVCEESKVRGIVSIFDVMAGSLIEKAREGHGA